jgi:hypothetical protein
VSNAARTRTLRQPGSLLGVLDTITTSTTTIELRAGDIVMLYTDGITDLSPPTAWTRSHSARWSSIFASCPPPTRSGVASISPSSAGRLTTTAKTTSHSSFVHVR